MGIDMRNHKRDFWIKKIGQVAHIGLLVLIIYGLATGAITINV